MQLNKIDNINILFKVSEFPLIVLLSLPREGTMYNVVRLITNSVCPFKKCM